MEQTPTSQRRDQVVTSLEASGPAGTPPGDHDGRAAPPAPLSRVHSRVGIAVAVLFFALSLLPSLLPRTPMLQGVVTGASSAVGYGVGVVLDWLWGYLSLPRFRPGSVSHRIVRALTIGGLAVLSGLTVWQKVGWQNDIRMLFGMDPITPVGWGVTILVAVVTGVLLVISSRAVRRLFRLLSSRLARRLPDRLARVLGVVAVVGLITFTVNGVVVNGLFAAANSAFSGRDATTDDDVTPPVRVERSGSPDSLVEWETLGRQGRNFVSRGPTLDELEAFHGEDARHPIRVYAGLRSGETIQDRADLVLAELLRTEAFDREVLVLATTTGTGFLEPSAVDSLEFLHKGDTAIAGVQYSYLPSWISLLADQEITRETSRVVFRTVHDHWLSLPDDERPELYLYGLSLGSFGVESILSSVAVINSPVDGALMTGPPFVNDLWNTITDNRDEGSPASLPVYDEGRTVRFTSRENALDEPVADWGATRVVYLQHASDPVTFFSPDLVVTRPDWLKPGQRGPDVSERMVFVPFVTAVQTLIDLPGAGNVPEGFGHLFSVRENIDAWAAVSRPDGWTDVDAARLEEFMLERRAP